MNDRSHRFLDWDEQQSSTSRLQSLSTVATGCNRSQTGSTSSKGGANWINVENAARTQKVSRMTVRAGSMSCMAVWTRMASRTPVVDRINVAATVTKDSPWNPMPSHRATAVGPWTSNSDPLSWSYTPLTRVIVVEPPTTFPTTASNRCVDEICHPPPVNHRTEQKHRRDLGVASSQ
jgi:hypothetical protein